jgi:D-tagatose-1,6-bisphosphate aldolase subunit GatZ/KbaZ
MTPAAFVTFLRGIAGRVGFDPARIVLGGDHLGPNPWTQLPAAAAMDKAEAMVDAYVAAGFRKIHLDCSMSCAGDPVPLPEAEIVRRAVRLARAAESAFARSSKDGAGGEPPVYVIGTEVPVPGGATESIEGLVVTSPRAALATLEAHRQAFLLAGLEGAWSRVIASVVQPGVEFDHHNVIDYGPQKARELSHAITAVPNIVYEAHSTDYQTRDALRALVQDHFAIL